MRQILKEKYPLIFFLVFFLVFFRKIIFLGLMPIPSDLLISFYFPFSSGGFSGYTPWVGNKGLVADDSLRQQYPWKLFSSVQIQKGELPLWNPYAFSGYPLLSNVQTGVFYPLNLMFVFFDPKFAWTLLIILQPLLGSLFMYKFLRSINLGKIPSLFGALIFINMSFEMYWLEQMIIGHTTLWLPLVLLSIQKLFEGQKKWFLGGILGLVLSIFGGYPQTTFYVFIISFCFLVHKTLSIKDKIKKRKLFVVGNLMFILAIGLTAVQILPTLEIYRYSAREGPFSEGLYQKSLAPLRNVLTLFSADFFGSKATHNFWGDEHTDFNHFFGIIPLLISITGIYFAWKKRLSLKEGELFLGLALIGWLFSVASPLGFLPGILHIPILSTGVVARFLFVFQFSMCILSAVSINLLAKEKDRKFSLKPGLMLGFLILFILYFLYQTTKISTDYELVRMYSISIRNLLFSFIILSAGFISLIFFKKNSHRHITIWFFIFLTSFEFLYLGNKYLPMAKSEYLFPQHPLFSYLQKQAGINRVWGQAETYLTTNFPTVYQLHYSDGYDSLYIKRYGELIYSSRDGKIPQSIPRSDVNLSPNKENWQYKERMLDILGIKYVLDKNDNPKWNWEPETWKFPEDRYKLIWQNGKFKVYQNLKAWPRIYFAKDIIFKTQNQEIIDSLLKEKSSNLAIIEEKLLQKVSTGVKSKIENLEYTPNKIYFTVLTDKDSFLVISDNYFPGWKAFIDGKETKIYRTNYTFRGIVIPKGNHKIKFSYEPFSLKIGMIISILSILLIVIIAFILRTKNTKLAISNWLIG